MARVIIIIIIRSSLRNAGSSKRKGLDASVPPATSRRPSTRPTSAGPLTSESRHRFAFSTKFNARSNIIPYSYIRKCQTRCVQCGHRSRGLKLIENKKTNNNNTLVSCRRVFFFNVTRFCRCEPANSSCFI